MTILTVWQHKQKTIIKQCI